MTLPPKLLNPSIPWFPIGVGGIFVVSVILRFWGLGRFNTLVFDEVYYAQFGNDFLRSHPYYNAHPPLSHYFIAFSIWVGQHLPIEPTAVNGKTGSMLAPWMYRWFNAFMGSFIPLVVAAIAYHLTQRRLYSFLAALLIAADGLFLVESRYALNNVYLVILGLLGQLLVLIALQYHGVNRWIRLALGGFCLGAAAAIKWNGLGFLLGMYLLIGASYLSYRFSRDGTATDSHESIYQSIPETNSPPILQRLRRLNLVAVGVNLVIVPILVYSLLWIPHLQLNPSPNFWQMQHQILTYHEGIKANAHPYCSTWWTWPLMIRPVAYFYQAATQGQEVDPILPELPTGMSQVVYDVHAMGNPFLWWFSTLALVGCVGILGTQLWRGLQRRQTQGLKSPVDEPSQPLQTVGLNQTYPPLEVWLMIYVIFNWCANLLPWLKVTRCVFLYHYMGCSVFAAMGLAWWVERWLQSPKRLNRGIGVTAIFVIIAAFLFWMPVYLGLPITPAEWKMRMWLSSWI